MIIECVPNFSEGRDTAVVAAIADAASAVADAKILNVSSDRDHNRSVLTIAGSPEAVGESALAAVGAAIAGINLQQHQGIHPRLGAADVVPFVPVADATLEDCARLARRVGETIWEQFAVPVYLYEAAALRPECTRLENIRRHPGLPPDFGHDRHPTAGACVVGARNFLIAWNINLRTTDLTVAKDIARTIRESSGGLPGVKALGLALESRGQSQVSINLVDFERTPLHVVFNAVEKLCAAAKIEIAGSELIGMIPQAAWQASRQYDLRWENFTEDLILENRLR